MSTNCLTKGQAEEILTNAHVSNVVTHEKHMDDGNDKDKGCKGLFSNILTS